MPFVEFQNKPTILVFMQIFKLKIFFCPPFSYCIYVAGFSNLSLLLDILLYALSLSYAINPFDSDD